MNLVLPTVYANMAALGLPKNIEALANEGSVKLFGKWETADVDVSARSARRLYTNQA